MRTLNATALSLQAAAARRPAFRIKASNHLYTKTLVGTTRTPTAGAFATSIPVTLGNNGNTVYMSGRRSNGQVVTQTITDIDTPGTGSETTGATPTLASMRVGYQGDKAVTATWTWNNQATLYGNTAENGGAQWSTAVVPPTLVDNATLVVRIEATCRVTDGVVVAVGTHDFSQGLSTIAFYLMTPTLALPMRTRIEMDLKGTKGNWWDVQPAMCYISAIDAPGSGFYVLANDSPTGRPVGFFWKDGVESELAPVVQIAKFATETQFWPMGITKWGTEYLLRGMFKRTSADGSAFNYECYLTSIDLKNWSFGERNHYILDQANSGGMIVSGSSMYDVSVSKTHKFQKDTQTDITANVINGNFSQAIDNADTAQISTTTNAIPELKEVSLELGHYDSTTPNPVPYYTVMGTLISEGSGRGTTPAGASPYGVQLRDKASFLLAHQRSPIDVENISTTLSDSLMDAFNGMIIRAGTTQVTATASAISHSGLNDPFLATTVLGDDRDGIMRATVKFLLTDQYSAQAIGLLFGADDSGNYNAFVVPRNSSWSKNTNTAKVLRGKPVGDTLWDHEQDTSGIWATNVATGYNRILSVPNVTATGALAGSYTATGTWAFQSGIPYDLMMKTQGDTLAMYVREHDMTPANVSAKATWSRISEYKLSRVERKYFNSLPKMGVIMGTDVFVLRDGFDDSGVGDMTEQLTDVPDWQETEPAYTKNMYKITCSFGAGEYQRTYMYFNPCPVNEGGPNLNPNATADGDYNVRPGMIFKWEGVDIPASGSLWVITSMDSSYGTGGRSGTTCRVNFKRLYDGSTVFSGDQNTTMNSYAKGMTDADTYAKLNSNYTVDSISDIVVETSAGGTKIPGRSAGKSMIINDDTSAAAARYVETDGIIHSLWSGSPVSFGAWEYQTNPVAVPRVWRMMLSASRFFVGDATTLFGLPSSGYFYKEGEIMRYAVEQFIKPGYYPGLTAAYTKWTVVPTLYAPLQAGTGPLTRIKNWQLSGNRPGDDLGNATIGDLVEIISRNSGSTDALQPEIAYHVANRGTVLPGTNTDTSWIDLDVTYPNDILEGGPGLTGGDIAIISGRGALGTQKKTHTVGSPTLYYPSSTKFSKAIELTHFGHGQGLFNTTFDEITRTCAHFGVRDVTQRYLKQDTILPSTSKLTAISSISDFTIDATTHIPSGNALRFDFRSNDGGTTNYYQVTIAPSNSTAGLVDISLYAPGDAVISGSKLVESIPVRISDYFLCSSTLTTYTASTSKKLDIRLIVKGNRIQVEINRVLAHIFFLDHLTDGTNSYKVLAAGPLKLSFANTTTSSIIYSVSEMWDEMEAHIIDVGQAGIEALQWITAERLIKTRTTPTGGLEFGRFITRDGEDHGPTLTDITFSDAKSESAFGVSGHMQVSGAEIADWIDGSWIDAHGYSFSVGQNRLLNTKSDSQQMARFLIREGKESSVQNEVAIRTRLDLQPEDVIVQSYTGGGNIATLGATTYVVDRSSIDFSFGRIVQQLGIKVAYAL